MFAISASHRRAADSVKVSNTVCRSKVERLINLSTSAVPVCCCKDLPQFIEQSRILDSDDGLVGESSHHFDLFRRKRLRHLSCHEDYAAGLSIPQEGDAEHRS